MVKAFLIICSVDKWDSCDLICRKFLIKWSKFNVSWWSISLAETFFISYIVSGFDGISWVPIPWSLRLLNLSFTKDYPNWNFELNKIEYVSSINGNLIFSTHTWQFPPQKKLSGKINPCAFSFSSNCFPSQYENGKTFWCF